MKLHLAQVADKNVVTGYGRDHVMVNRRRYDRSLVILPERLIENWDVPAFPALAREHFQFLAGLDVEIVLLGTGERLRFPHPSLLEPLVQAGIGYEIMDTYAACRTYNILMAEDRKVVAALILG
jgi:uncharacterized protein